MPAADPVVSPPGDMQRGAKRQLIDKRMHLARKLGHLRDDPLTRSERRRKRAVLHGLTLEELRVSTRRASRTVRRQRTKRHGARRTCRSRPS